MALILASCASKPAEQPEAEPTPAKPPICAVESPELCLQDGVDLFYGLNREPDREAAKQKFALACEGGNQRGCTYLGMILKESGESGDVLRGIELLDQACDAGITMGCAQLGAHLFGRAWMKQEQSGEPATEAFVAAVRRLRKACEAQETTDAVKFWGFTARGYACTTLGSAFEQGFGVKKNVSLAFDLHRQACELGYTGGCAQVGFFVQHGMATPADPAAAAQIYADACDRGDDMACTNLAHMLVEGEHIADDPDRASEILNEPCHRGYPGACELLREIETFDE